MPRNKKAPQGSSAETCEEVLREIANHNYFSTGNVLSIIVK
jgi:hypothetical protein